MNITSTNDAAGFRLRANPAYELVLLDRLSVGEREALGALCGDPDCYGILRPRAGAQLAVQSVSNDAALLFYTLRDAGALPQYAMNSMGSECGSAIARMVLDRIFEIEANGEMLSGPAAYEHVCGQISAGGAEGALASLSYRALECAQELGLKDAAQLSMRLYGYNHAPASARWHRLLPDAAAVEKYLAVASGPGTAMLQRNWSRAQEGSDASPWLGWDSNRAQLTDSSVNGTYKLYVSPACDSVREAFQATAEAAAQSVAFSLKVGYNVYGLLRPDKIVVYFNDFSALQETASRIVRNLAGCPAQGVPFTAELAGQGLLSWGMDPPAERHTVSWMRRESWRLWVCNRLAAALQVHGSQDAGLIAPARFAMERLRLEGVDTRTWTPPRGLALASRTGA